MSAAFKQLVQGMVEAWNKEIENDEDINGGDAVEWIQGFYEDCKKALAEAEQPNPMQPAIVWDKPLHEVGDEDEEDGGRWSKLLGCVTIAGVPHHIEGWAIRYTDDVQEAVSMHTNYEDITDYMTEGAGQTVTINDRDYFMVVTPYQV